MRIIYSLLIVLCCASSCSKKGGDANPTPPVDTTTTPIVIKDQPDNGKDTIGNWQLIHHRDVDGLAAWTQLVVPAKDTAYLVNTAWLPTSAYQISFDGGKTWSDGHFMITNNEFLCMIDGTTGLGYRKTYGTTGGSDIDAVYWSPEGLGYYRLVYNASGIGGLRTSGISFPSRQVAYVTFTNGESVRLNNPVDYASYKFNSAGTVPMATSDLCFPDNINGWLCTSDGQIQATQDSSKTWSSQLIVSGTGFSQICFIDNKTGWAASYNNSIYTTTDGGINWKKIAVPGITSQFVQMVFTSKTRGFFITGREVYETSDGGSTWKRSCKMGTENFQSITKLGTTVYILSLGGDNNSTWATILSYQ